MSGIMLSFEFIELENEEIQNKQLRRQELRRQTDPFLDLDDSEFIKRYRLSKELAQALCDEIRPLLRQPKKSTDLSAEQKVLTTLSFYGTGSYQRPIGDISAHSLAQQTVSKVINEVTACIDSPQLRMKYIRFPQNFAERNTIRTKFYQKFCMPGVLGCIDCTQIAIIRPAIHEERYFCRKHYHSLNVQLICDAEMQILSVDSSYGGATHDSFIWNTHPIKTFLENLNESTWLLGDSAYPLRKYMMTPILNTVTGTPESHYTDVHARTRNLIERTIGLLKARFRCLLVHRVLHYTPEKAASIVNACVILHNMCNEAQIPVLDEGQVGQMDESSVNVFYNNEYLNNEPLHQGMLIRNNLVQRLWQSPENQL
ncbi:putative nuclease HARBI1 [Pieris napi]|uniref:putative nuclease HARBI1 n=1 Tax=Pieris napi TaxID=78633 RepID=UPI001FB93CAB|nr:putative nuclease HARBI1 [Pieris napi]